jgi:hypothetical protein
MLEVEPREGALMPEDKLEVVTGEEVAEENVLIVKFP